MQDLREHGNAVLVTRVVGQEVDVVRDRDSQGLVQQVKFTQPERQRLATDEDQFRAGGR